MYVWPNTMFKHYEIASMVCYLKITPNRPKQQFWVEYLPIIKINKRKPTA